LRRSDAGKEKKQMKIIIDAMGGDNAPDEIVRGAVEAAEAYGIDIILTGKGEQILKSLEKMGRSELPKGVEIANASQVVTMEDDPVAAMREKKDSSIAVGLTMLRDGYGDAFVSAGSTGALLTAATLIVKRIRGIRGRRLHRFCPSPKRASCSSTAGPTPSARRNTCCNSPIWVLFTPSAF
jgi:glycerol-3-phosphate acyltransferase PlsX